MEGNEQKKVVIELQNVKRNFIVGDEVVHALRGVSFKIHEGEFVTIMGTSEPIRLFGYAHFGRIYIGRRTRPHHEAPGTGSPAQPQNRFCIPKL